MQDNIQTTVQVAPSLEGETLFETVQDYVPVLKVLLQYIHGSMDH